MEFADQLLLNALTHIHHTHYETLHLVTNIQLLNDSYSEINNLYGITLAWFLSRHTLLLRPHP